MRSDWRRAGEGGFTLIEVVVALVLLGILLVLAIPSLSGYLASRNLDLAGQQVVADLRSAQDRARTQRLLVRVTFTGGSGTYTVATWNPTSGQISDRCNLSLLATGGGGTWVPAERVTLPSGVTVSAVPLVNPLVFSCLGLPYDAQGNPVSTDQSLTVSNQAGSRTALIGAGGQVLCVKQPDLQPAPCPY